MDVRQFVAHPAHARSHTINNFDFTIFKNTKLTERFGLQYRTEIFNLFNRVGSAIRVRRSASHSSASSAASTTIRG